MSRKTNDRKDKKRMIIGQNYVARPKTMGCHGCAGYANVEEDLCAKLPFCSRYQREDKRDLIFVPETKEMK